MRRRVATIFRRGLFVLGVLLLVWMPVSCFIILEASTQRLLVDVNFLTLGIGHVSGADPPPDVLYTTGIRTDEPWGPPPLGVFLPGGLLYEYHTFTGRTVRIPLWLLAFICLAWPVTSFILARRKPKRGFPVEPEPPDAAVPPSPGGG